MKLELGVDALNQRDIFEQTSKRTLQAHISTLR